MKIKKIDLQFPKEKKILICSIVNTLLIVGGVFAYNFAVAKGQTAIVAPIAGAYPVLFATLAYFIFRDRLGKQQILGIITTLLGIVLLSIIPA